MSADKRDVYSPYKASHHQDRLDLIRQGKQPYPVLIQLIISDLCNENCFVAGTKIDTPNGLRNIEDIKNGDLVYGLSGKILPVVQIGSRVVDEVFEIECNGKKVVCSGEHPFLTKEGWKEAKDLNEEDETVMRLRMRSRSKNKRRKICSRTLFSNVQKSTDSSRAHDKSEPNTIWSWSDQLGRSSIGNVALDWRMDQTVQPENELKIISIGTSESAVVSVRMPTTSKESSRKVESLYQKSSESSSDETRHQGQVFASNEAKQSNEKSRCGYKVTCEGSGKEIKDRTEVRKLHNEFKSSNSVLCERGKYTSDWKSVSGLQSYQSGKSNRNQQQWSLPSRLSHETEREYLRNPNDKILSEKLLVVHGDIHSQSQGSNASCSGEIYPKLYLDGLRLERGLGLCKISSIRRIKGSFVVYNFHCPPEETYEANGFAVHNCHFCAYRMDNYTSNAWFGEKDPVSGIINNNPNRMIPYEKVVEILDDCVQMGTRAVEVTGGGEPTVHPKHREIFEGIIERNLDGALVTNGVLLRSGVAELISNFKWVRVSVDAANPKTYSQMREVPESYFPKVIEHIGKIVSARSNNSSSDLVIGMGFVVTRENYKEIMEATKIAADLGVDNIRFSAMFGTDGMSYFEDIYEECRDTVREAVAKFQTPNFTVFNLFGDRISDLQQQNPDYKFCGYMNLQTYIGGDQNVYRCCNTAYNPQGFIGSIKLQSLKQLWDSKAKQTDFNNFDASTCNLCMQNSKNKYINYLIHPDPDHKNFI